MGLVTLTFDNGPTPAATPAVLAALSAASVRAHFFVLGKHVATDVGRGLLREVLAAGHLVGNHSYSHEVALGDDLGGDDPAAPTAGAGAVARELEATRLLLEPLLPATDLPRRFRPFGGGGVLGPHLLSPAAVAWLGEHRHDCVLWNCVPGDWKDADGWVDVALAAVSGAAALDHAVVVLHDVPNACAAGLPRFLRAAQSAGARFVDFFPPACLPVRNGAPQPGLGAVVRGTFASSPDVPGVPS